MLSSDAFFPFRDSIDRAAAVSATFRRPSCSEHTFKQFVLQSGVKYVVSPGGSTQDDVVIKSADEHSVVLIHSGLRLFHH